MNDSENKQFNILCLSGGGFRGLYTAKVLAEIEKSLGRPIARSFDLIAGTSIGGIIAMAIALEIPVSEIVDKFKERGGKIFPPKRVFPSKRPLGIFKSRYKQEELKKLVSELFDNKTMLDITNMAINHRLIIPTVNYTTGRPQFFKTPHHDYYKSYNNIKLKDVALATSAAPYYFPVHEIGDSSYVDGGLYGNSPGMLALHEAMYFLKKTIDDIHFLSVGTMSPKTVRDTRIKTNMGIWDWKEDIFNLTISVQEQIVDLQLEDLLGSNRYHRVDDMPQGSQAKNTGLSVATKAAIRVLMSAGKSSAQYFLSSKGADILNHTGSSFSLSKGLPIIPPG